jgi:hypothetical protein
MGTDGSQKYISILRSLKSCLNVFGSGVIDLGNALFICNGVNPNGNQDTLTHIAGGSLVDLVLVVAVGVDELEEDLEMHRVIVI